MADRLWVLGAPDPEMEAIERLLREGRIKVVCQSGSPEQIRAFMEAWAPANGLIDIYGDPARDFAGGYQPNSLDWLRRHGKEMTR